MKLKSIYRNTKISNNQEDNITVSGIQSKISKHWKKQENPIHNEEKCQSIEIDPELWQTLELADKDRYSRFISRYMNI